MADISVTWNAANGYCDWTLGSGDLVTGGSLVTAILLSLFTDKVATADFKLPPGDIDRRGWWADAYGASPLGSNLWQLERGIKNSGTLSQAISYATIALQWLIDDGVVSKVEVIADWQGADGEVLAIQVTVTEPDSTVSRFEFSWAWSGN